MTAVFIVTDLLCALLPLTFIYKINRPIRERLVLAVLMGLGIIATGCGIAKLASVKVVMNSKDPFWESADLGIWGYV